jgi:hypothetical protein
MLPSIHQFPVRLAGLEELIRKPGSADTSTREHLPLLTHIASIELIGVTRNMKDCAGSSGIDDAGSHDGRTDTHCTYLIFGALLHVRE